MTLDFDRLYAERATNPPRVHGNGFLQLDLSGATRLHVWDDRLPSQHTSTQIHDHVFSMRSTVLVGKLYHLVLEESPEPGESVFNVYTAQRQEGTENTILAPTGEEIAVRTREVFLFQAGMTYEFEPFTFHMSLRPMGVPLTATLMRKTAKHPGEARVLVAPGETPDNDFDRDAQDPELLWTVVRDALDQRLAQRLATD